MLETSDFYLSLDPNDKLECFQALKKRERFKFVKEIFEKHKQILQEENSLNNLYIKNLKNEINDEEFKKIFSKYGEIKSLKITKKKELDSFSVLKSEIWTTGFVSFYNEDNSKKAKLDLNNSTSFAKPGLKLYVDYFENKKQRQINLKAKHNSKKKLKLEEQIDLEIINNCNDVKNINYLYYNKNNLLIKKTSFIPLHKNLFKKTEDLNLENRLFHIIGNDFDFVYAKFRREFQVVINDETSIDETDKVKKLIINLDKNFISKNNSHLQYYPFIYIDNPILKILKKEYPQNKFDDKEETKFYDNNKSKKFMINDNNNHLNKNNDILLEENNQNKFNSHSDISSSNNNFNQIQKNLSDYNKNEYDVTSNKVPRTNAFTINQGKSSFLKNFNLNRLYSLRIVYLMYI